MPLSPSVPSLYTYGFITSRTVRVLSRPPGNGLSEDDRKVLKNCMELVEKVIRGRDALIGRNPELVRDLRPDDVEVFTYVLTRDSEVMRLASEQETLRTYFQQIFGTLQALNSDPPKHVDETSLVTTRNFLERVANALLETAKESVRSTPGHGRGSRAAI